MSMIDHVGVGDYRLPDKVDASRLDLVAEFMVSPLGRHSDALQLLLSRMRSDRSIGRLLVVQAHTASGFWLAEAPRKRGEPYRPLQLFATQEDAERAAFAIRWHLHTGEPLPGVTGSAIV